MSARIYKRLFPNGLECFFALLLIALLAVLNGCAGVTASPNVNSSGSGGGTGSGGGSVAVSISSLPSGTVGTAYSATLQATGGTTPYSWSVSSGSLPAGLTLNASSGAISGTPTASGTSSFTVKVTDASSNTATASLSISVAAASQTLSISTSSVPAGTIGTAYSVTLKATGGTTPYTWTLSSGSLPTGLTLNSSTGVISGTPTAAGSSAFTVQAKDSSSPVQTATKSLTLAVAAATLAISTSSLPESTVGTAYSATFQATGGTSPYTWSIISGSLPSGLSLNPNGQISGSPSTQGTSSFSVQVHDSSSPAQTASDSYSIVVTGSTSGNPAGCGATAGGASQYDQSQCGNVAPYPTAAAGAAISSCQSISAGTYHLISNIGSSQSAICLTLTSGPVVLDLAGFAITGRVVGSGINPGGTHIYSSASGGTITCNDSSGTNPGCLVVANSGGAANAPLEIDHLTITNEYNATSGTPRNLYIDWAPTSNSFGATTPILLVHNVTSTAGQSTSSARIYNFALQVHGAVAAYDNNVTCLSNSGACQGITVAGSGGPGATDVKVYNNYIEMQELNSSVTGDTGRAINCDGSGDSTNVLGCEVYNNYVDTHDSRGLRLREVSATDDVVSIHDNLFDNINSGSTSIYDDALHLCDPNSGTDNGTGYDIHNNTINVSGGGIVLMARNCTGFPTFENNTINGTNWTGLFTWTRSLGGGPSTLKVMNNSGVSTSANPQSSTEAGATLEICNSGVAGGAGIITALLCSVP